MMRSPPDMITVASYNIRKAIGSDRRRRPERILEVLSELDADIIALQEADRRFGPRISAIPPQMLEEMTGYKPVPVALRPHSMGWHGNALLVRKDAEVQASCALHLPSIEPRGAVTADIHLNGMTFRVVGLHLDLSGLWRRRQVRSILHYLDTQAQPLPTIMMGDTNEWSRNGGCLHDFSQHHDIVETGPSFHARRPIGTLDRIIVSTDLTTIEAGVHHSARARVASDHLPVWARLRPKRKMQWVR